MNLRKSLVKPVTQQYIFYSVLSPEIVCTTHLMLFSEHPPIYALGMPISGERTEQHVVIGFGELAAVD